MIIKISQFDKWYAEYVSYLPEMDDSTLEKAKILENRQLPPPKEAGACHYPVVQTISNLLPL